MKYVLHSCIIAITLLFLNCHNLASESRATDSVEIEFKHGIASGDPLEDAVIIWTKVTPITPIDSLEVIWEMASTPRFEEILKSGKALTTAEKDYTLKVDVTGLNPGTYYYYRFKNGKNISPIGRTITAPSRADSLRFAVASCSNYEWGYFNAYGRIAEEENLNAVIHLGDYIYEYGNGVYGDTTIGRLHVPKHEILTLSDYRTRYAQYREDQDLQAMHANHPMIAIWDDHEITNNAYIDGAQNHQPQEGDYEKRKAIAKQVYYEWMPIRESEHLYRDFNFGNLANLYMLDERLAGRTKQADSLEDPTLYDDDRSMLGKEQFNWLLNELDESETTWNIIGNQVIFSYQNWAYENFTFNLDGWDGYPVEQKKLVEEIKSRNVDNLIFVTGDTHTSWAFESTNNPFEGYNPTTGEGAIAIDRGVTSINSANANESRTDEEVRAHEKKVVKPEFNPHLKYVNMRDHGYLLLSLYPSWGKAEFKTIATTREPDSTVKTDRTFKFDAGSQKLQEVATSN
ncbi:MAG: alkaline phosphatase D family protein [Flavobacteriaceae bacterium]|nr:alkaline phosphatase D family protein [Flavobacteriaceae bacterium]